MGGTTMKFFEWLNGPQQTEAERAISYLSKYKVCNRLSATGSLDHLLVGNISASFFWKKATFNYCDVRFSKAGTEAMISKNGTVHFFFASKEEVDELKLYLNKTFGLNYEF